jgi:prepilin-type processing-associated H-X9-DG protein
MADSPPSFRLSLFALLSLVLGLTGPLGVLAGYWGLYEINASDGRLRGRYLAYAGMALGVIATATLALGLIALAVMQLWRVSGRVECANNLGQIGLAVQAYHNDNERLYPRGTFGPADLAPEQRLSFHAGILTYLQQRPGTNVNYRQVFSTLDFKQAWDADVHKTALQTTIPTYVCRDDGGVLPDQPGLTHYIGITGLGSDAARLPKDHPCAGFFGYDRQIGDNDVAEHTSYLIMVTETAVDNGPWLAAAGPTLRAAPTNDRNLPQQVASLVGATTQSDGPGPLVAAPLLSLTPAEGMSCLGPGRPFGGLHQGGANALHVDGSVLFLSDTIHAQVFRQLILLRHDKRDAIEPP